MDVFIESLNGKIEEIEAKIQKINYIQEFDKAKEFEKKFHLIQARIEIMKKVERKSDLYYYTAMDALDVISFEIDDYLETEGKIKEQDLNRTIFFAELRQFIYGTKGKSPEKMLSDLRQMVQEINGLELEKSLFSELYSLTAKACLKILIEQAKNKKTIDLSVVEEVTTKKNFAKEIQNQLVIKAKEQRNNESIAFDILTVSQAVNEQNIGDLKIWKILCGDERVKIKQRAYKKELLTNKVPKENNISLERNIKRAIVNKIRDIFGRKDGTTLYTFGKLNRKTGKYEDIRMEQHRFPPKGMFFIKRCQSKCIELEINDADTVEIATIGVNMPKVQRLSFGRNVREIRRGKLSRKDTILLNLKIKIEEINQKKVPSKDNTLSNLKKVEFSDDVEILGAESFANCTEIIDVKCGENLSKIGNSAFRGCKNLQKINFPDELSEIGEKAFDGCSKLQNIKLPDNLSEIGFAAFSSLKNNKNSPLHIPRKISDSYPITDSLLDDNYIRPIQAFPDRNIFRYRYLYL